MRKEDRYLFEVGKDYTTVTVTQRNKGKIVLLLNHNDAEIIERQSYNLSFANSDGFRAKVYIHWKGQSRITLARWVLGIQDTSKVITYRNLDSFDFREGNLVLIENGQPSQNRSGAQKNNLSSGIRGVSWHKNYEKWMGQVVHKGKHHTVGYDANIKVIEQAVIAKRRELLEHSFQDQL